MSNIFDNRNWENLPHIKGVITSIQPGYGIIFTDFDHTLINTGASHRLQNPEYGLITSENAEAYKVALEDAERNSPGKDVKHCLRVGYYKTCIDETLCGLYNLQLGTPISDEAFYRIGQIVAKDLLKQEEVFEPAFRFLAQKVDQKNKVIILTASSRPYIQGVTYQLCQTYGLSPTAFAVIGTEYQYDNQIPGKINRLYVHMKGDNKSTIVVLAREKGAHAILGIGDIPEADDKFMGFCQSQLTVPRRNGMEFWTNIVNTSTFR